MNEIDLIEELHSIKQDWARKNKQASYEEDLKKSVFAAMFLELKKTMKGTVKEIEYNVFASDQYKNYIQDVNKLREDANLLFAKVEYYRYKIDMIKSDRIQKAVDLKFSDGRGD